MSNKPVLGGINSILRKQREEATSASNSGPAIADAAKVANVATPTTDQPHSATEERGRNDLPGDTPPLDVDLVTAVPDVPDTAEEATLPPKKIARGVDFRPNDRRPNRQQNKIETHRLTPPPVPAEAKIISDASPDTGAYAVADVSPHLSDSKALTAKPPDIRPPELYERSGSVGDSSTAFSLGDQVLKLNLTGNELRLYDFIYSSTIAIGQSTCRVNIKDLQNHLGLTQMSVFRILNRLEIKRGIRRRRIEENRRLIGIELSLVL